MTKISQLQLDEQNEGDFDFLCTGFKIRSSGTDANGDGDDYVYMAFANAPTVNSKGIPVNTQIIEMTKRLINSLINIRKNKVKGK